MRRVYLDTNVLVEILFDRQRASKCLELLHDTSQQYVISVLTVHIIWYLAERYKLRLTTVDEILTGWEVLALTPSILQLARQRYDGKDFGDCIQATSAEIGECYTIITIDKKFEADSHSSIKVILVD